MPASDAVAKNAHALNNIVAARKDQDVECVLVDDGAIAGSTGIAADYSWLSSSRRSDRLGFRA